MLGYPWADAGQATIRSEKLIAVELEAKWFFDTHSTFVDIEYKNTSVNYICLHCFTRGGLLVRIAKKKKIWVANPCLHCPRPTLVRIYFLSLRRLNKQD